MSRTPGRHSRGRRIRSVTIKPGAETLARKEKGADCKICRRAIELGDHIMGVLINGLGNEWNCHGKCGAEPEYVEDEDGVTERLPCKHYSPVNWVHGSCCC